MLKKVKFDLPSPSGPWPLLAIAVLVVIAVPLLFLKPAPHGAPASDSTGPAPAAPGKLPARAERLIHSDRAAAARAVASALPDRPTPLVERIVSIYQLAVPPTPEVSVDGLRTALALYPASKRAPDLSTVDLAAFIDDRFARATAGHH